MENEILNGIYLVLILGVFYFMMFRKGGCCGHSHSDHGQNIGHSSGRSENGKTKDPVCGMEGDPAEAAGSREHMGQTFYFCSANCMEKFDKDPAAYADLSQKGSRGTNKKKHGGCC